uniref:Codesane n=1 Tax=Colletes daviesanus TaxID=420712 RepID=COD_COLDA|nr:RecName: Full=Codesane; Short=COD; AltName: Full=Codesan [Colletes daviesanus]
GMASLLAKVLPHVVKLIK